MMDFAGVHPPFKKLHPAVWELFVQSVHICVHAFKHTHHGLLVCP